MQTRRKKEPKNPQEANLKRYANVYVKKKGELLPLMEKASGEANDPNATHGELIRKYIALLRDDPEFANEVEGMMSKYNMALDPVTAIAEGVGKIFGTVSTFKEGANIRAQAEADQEAMLYGMILEGQKDHSTRNILIISGISVLAVGAMIYFISKRKK